jgi:hypothetical protein
LYLHGYVAYGTKDEEFKYSAGFFWLLTRQPKPRAYINALFIHDLDRSTNYYDNSSTDNIFSLIARKPGVPWKMSFSDDALVEVFKEYYSGFSHLLMLHYKTFNPYSPLPDTGIFFDGNHKPAYSITNTEAGLHLRYAYKERFVENRYRRISLGSRYPIVELRLGTSIPGFLNTNYNYQKVSLRISNLVKIAPFGSIRYNIFCGKTFSNTALPYPLLEIHPGNEYYAYNRFAFNMMNRYEFISDQYAGIHFEHNIGGGVFNYIPGLRKLKLRQFWTAKGLIGSLNAENTTLNFNKGYPFFRSLQDKPYIELGTGVSNIFEFLRIDFVWRVTPKSEEHLPFGLPFGIFGSVQIQF